MQLNDVTAATLRGEVQATRAVEKHNLALYHRNRRLETLVWVLGLYAAALTCIVAVCLAVELDVPGLVRAVMP